MAWASPLTSTTLFVFSTLVLVATGFVATWRVKRGAGWRLSKPGTRASTPGAARKPTRPGPPTEADKREPFMAPAGDRQERAATPALPSRTPRPHAAPPQAEPGSGPSPGAGGALYIGSVNLTPPPAPAKRATQPAQPGVGTKRPAIESRTSQARPEDFMQWLRDGMATRTLQINTPQSALHFTDTDMVLVYPSIFQAYANACAAPAIKGPAATSAERIQTVLDAVCSLGWHESGPFDSRLLHFELLQPRAEPSILKGVVIQSPQRFINPLPPPNPALSRLI